jgi:long-chain acyl-CoA synthetase
MTEPSEKKSMERVDTTLPKLLMEKAQVQGSRIALREKYKGIWKEISWDQYLEKVKYFCLGLVKLGLEKGDHVSILGENCKEWLFADLGTQCAGGVTVGIYPTNPVPQVEYILDHSQSKFVVVKDQEQADKVLAVKEKLPLLKKMIVIDMKGMRHYDEPFMISYRKVEALGGQLDQENSSLFRTFVDQTQPEDVALIVYTSGTTGHPKGAMISHRNIIHQTVHGTMPILHFTERDTLVSYLPLCHIFERNLSMCIPLVVGYTINFAESVHTVQQNIQEISPTFFAAVPRILEKIYSGIQIKMEDSTRLKKFLYHFWMPVGRKVSEYRMRHQRLPMGLFLAYLLGYLCSFRSIRDKIGLLRCRCLMSGGAPIAPEILDFFRALGIYTIEMYGLTETSGTAAGPHRSLKYGSVGEPCQALEFRLDESGEIHFAGDSIFVGYYRDEKGTREVIPDGWLHTGDVGKLDEDGHLYIIDRIKDIIITSGGKNISPSEIENKLKCSPYIKEAMVIGDRRPYLTALLQIDYENVSNFAQNSKIPYTTFRSLVQNPAIYELLQEEVEKVNETLAQVETIKKFILIEKELDQDDNELTATQKVRRKQVSELFRNEIEALYH